MPFNPSLPVANSPILSAEMRNQFNGLQDLNDESIPASEKGAADGVASLDGAGRLVAPADWDTLVNKPVPVADGTYTMGFGTVQNGTITVEGGIITGIQEAVDAPPADVNVSGLAADPTYNGGYVANGTAHGKTAYQLGATAHWL